ncbi:MAG: sigma-70 family RNA polymerase sigma factor [Clostridiaceae bacterium]|nr:sigma-70 family RNA polymerase sigma factor [Clostridiaceae bacterium]
MDLKIGELVAAALNGDKNAFARLYELTLQSAYYLALRILKNEQDAMDMVQDSYVEAFCSLERLKKPESFEAWIKHITANNCRDWLKKKKNVLIPDERQAVQTFGEIEEDDAEFLPQDLLELKGSAKMITDIIDALPEEQRMTVLLYYYNEMPVSYIAEFLSCPEGTIKSRLYGARAKIKAEVEAWEKKGVKLYGMGATPMLALLLRRAIKEQRIDPNLYTKSFIEINKRVEANRLSKINAHPDTNGTSANDVVNKNTKTGGGQAKRFATDHTANIGKRRFGIISKVAAMTPQSQIILVVVSMVAVIGTSWGIYGISETMARRSKEVEVSASQEESSFFGAETTDGMLTEVSDESESEAAKADESFSWTVSKALNAYLSIKYFNEKCCVFKSSSTGKYGLIDCKGKVVVQPDYEGFIRCTYGRDYYGYNDYHYCVLTDGEYREINMDTYKISTDWHGGHGAREDGSPPSGFSEIDRYFGGLAAAKKNGKWGYVDKSLKTVIPFEYDAVNLLDTYEYSAADYCRGFDGKYVAVKKNGMMGIINKNNETVVPFEYSVIMQGKDGVYIAKKNGNWGLIGIGGVKPSMPKAETTAKAHTTYLSFEKVDRLFSMKMKDFLKEGERPCPDHFGNAPNYIFDDYKGMIFVFDDGQSAENYVPQTDNYLRYLSAPISIIIGRDSIPTTELKKVFEEHGLSFEVFDPEQSLDGLLGYASVGDYKMYFGGKVYGEHNVSFMQVLVH